MSFKEDLSSNKGKKLNAPNKATTLNPNAVEFVPAILRYASRNTSSADGTRLDISQAFGKPVLDCSDSSVSGNSDDEAHQYWHNQLPDDITPDFKVMGENEVDAPAQLLLADLSIHDGTENSIFDASLTNKVLHKQQNVSSHIGDNLGLSKRMADCSSTYAEDQTNAFMDLATKDWHKWWINDDKHFVVRSEENHYCTDSNSAFPNDSRKCADLEDTCISPLNFLASQFPGLSVESLAKVYRANGCNMDSTIEFLTEFQLRSSDSLHQNLKSKTLMAASLGMLDFPVLPIADAQNRLSKYERNEFQYARNTCEAPSGTSRGVFGNAAAARRFTFPAGPKKYERNGSAVGDFCAANTPLKVSEDVQDFTLLRNACFEKAKEAHLLGDKALARELNVKGQLLDMHMKAGHQKTTETVYQPRNRVSHDLQGFNHRQDYPIDLRGLHVTEAIHVLEHDLSSLKTIARSVGQALAAMIYMGTGHQTKGLNTPGQLVTVIKKYLLEEGFHYMQPQPGQLRVVIY